jgi:tRNA threonylcarbamoyl adenosine modification protein YjeE
MALELWSPSAEKTRACGEALGRVLPPGTVVAVSGPLGVGKSVFCQGALHALTGLDDFPSPTFTLVRSYPNDVHHLDLYRLEDDGEDLAEWLLPPAVALVEWPERGPWLLPADRVVVTLKPAATGRHVRGEGTGARSDGVVAAWARALGEPA